jgi:Ca2+-binding EF-hand superfamily protein
MLGMLDDNLDGKIEKSELKGQMGVMLGMAWNKLDTNGDGVLDKAEVAAASKMFGRRREAAGGGPSANTPIG